MSIDEVLEKNMQCPFVCETLSYPLKMTYLTFTDDYASFMYNHSFLKSKYPRGTRIEKIKQSIATLSLYFETLETTKITQLAKVDWIDLVANIGGFQGLLLGSSCVTIIEFFEIIYLLIKVFSH